jgi:hypothetical protein
MLRQGLVEEASLATTEDALADRSRAGERRGFVLTEKGRLRVNHWLFRPLLRPEPVRSEIIARLLALDGSDLDLVLRQLEMDQALYERHVSELTGDAALACEEQTYEDLLRFACTDAALSSAQAHIVWIRRTRARVEVLAAARPVKLPDSESSRSPTNQKTERRDE